MTRNKLPMAGAAVVLVALMAGCATGGQDVATGDTGAGPVAGMCAREQPDCVDTPQLGDDEPVDIDETGIEQLRRDAQFYLGASRSELNETVRIGRIGDEQMALTQDYVIGRITVELDEVDGDEVVTSATVELPDGPETFRQRG
jgi:hypothetical protein